MDQLEAVIYKFPVRSKQASPTEETGAVVVSTTTGSEANAPREQHRDFLKLGRKSLSESDLSTAAARRFLIAEIERLDAHCGELRAVEREYNELRVKHARLVEADRRSRWLEILSSIALSAGSAGLGAAPGYLSIEGAAAIGWTVVAASAALVVSSIISRIFQ